MTRPLDLPCLLVPQLTIEDGAREPLRQREAIETWHKYILKIALFFMYMVRAIPGAVDGGWGHGFGGPNFNANPVAHSKGTRTPTERCIQSIGASEI